MYQICETQENDYNTIIILFKKTLQQRGYPDTLVNKYTAIVKFSQRLQLLQIQPTRALPRTPIFSCLPPPHFNQLMVIILDQYIDIQKNGSETKIRMQKTQNTRTRASEGKNRTIRRAANGHQPRSQPTLSDRAYQSTRTTTNNKGHHTMPKQPCTTHLICNSSFKCTKTQITFPIRLHVKHHM